MKRGFCSSVLLLGLVFSSFSETRGIGVHAPAPAAVSEPEIVLQKNLVCNIYSVAYSPDGKLLAAGYDNNQIRIWDAKKGTLMRTLSGHTGTVWSVAFSPDGKTLISGSADKTIKFWDVQSGKELRTLKGHEDTVSFVTYSNDGVYIASGSADRTIKFWDPENGKLLQTLTGHTRTIASIAYSNDGKYMASASWDKTVKMYYAVGGSEIRTLTGHSDSVYAVLFSPDGKYLASGSADKSIKLWDVHSGSLSKDLKGSSDAVWSLAFSPDGKKIAGSSADGNVRIWDVETGKVLFTLKGHKSPVRSLAYSANGLYLTSGDSDGMIKIWDTATGKCLATMLQGNNGEWVTWTPEGFLTGSEWALKNLSYTVNGKQYAIAQIYDKLYRPDLVAAKIVGDNIEKEAEKSSLATIITRGGDMPDVSFTMERDQKTSRDINVSMHIKNVGGGIGKVLIKLNDRAFLVADGVSSKVGQTIDLEYPLSLRNGENTVSVTAYDSTGMQESAKNAQKKPAIILKTSITFRTSA
ncbi:MAG TPA: WD40 repeat domain-containing protein [Treponemataceae bacterium]|nr:WD40 repeat domain-containing protein [Treponemataceae bacterium]